MIVKAGLSQLQGKPWMIILASSFQLDVLGSYQSGYSQLQAAKKLDPNFMERFAIFSREQEQTQKESGAKNGGSSVDLVSYVEFQRNLRLVLKVHREALASMKTVWKLLLKEKVYFTAMVDAIKRVDVAVRNSERVYRQVLSRHPNSAKLLTLYARFLADVKNDAWAAAKWQAEAEKVDVEDNRNSNQAYEVPLDPKGGGGEVALQVVEARMVVISSASGIIQVAQGSQVLGYDKKELIGKNISIFMPQPFADQHPSFVRSHLVNGRRAILDQTSEFVILHKVRVECCPAGRFRSYGGL